ASLQNFRSLRLNHARTGPFLFHAATAPSASVIDSSGITSASSISSSVPSPWHVGHAPKGELNENSRGESSSSEYSGWSGSANLFEKLTSVQAAASDVCVSS